MYPVEPSSQSLPYAEEESPWHLDARSEIRFITLPHEIEAAVIKLRESVPLGLGLDNMAA